ncbi:PQQ-dependent sugar dehydrogenase [Aurantibacter crassamenti]|uniref:PKD domain-containing protein n=1 Tax=Aurantibacter crassamenti TaxID=1837375 RepID=UPI00193938FC|nr:malectin domain-containing carbohydrate-binding protein [Aurantibacter crassamenti]MBM1106784.1 PQQ-dependent sugar dehydrogenase [Aurantibacter crassamenti]
MKSEATLISKKSPYFDYNFNIDFTWHSYILVAFLLFVNITLTAQLPSSFQKVELLSGLSNTTTMRFAPDGRIFILDRYGEVIIYKPNSQLSVSAGTIPVYHEFEDGLLGIAFDPNFSSNSYIYLHYSVLAENKNRVSRFTMNGDILELNSEVILLDWETQRILSYHSGGDMDFDSQGNLYIATGDNTNHGSYSKQHKTKVEESAEKSSSNTNDLRGKILRITPQENGTYTIPPGNLFPVGTANTRAEIYVMGARNAYRISIDKENTDWLFWGEVGPDANSPSALGPEGLDEMNLVKSAGNYGWPYFSGEDNDAYEMLNITPSPFYNNPAAPVNTSPFNTGLTILPAAEPAWLEFFHESYFAGPRYYHNGALTDQQRFPVEFDEHFFYYDFNTSQIWAVKMDAQGNIINNEQLAPLVFPDTKNGFIDIEMGTDGHMYILAYGKGCCPSNVGTGKLIRVDYTGVVTNTPPVVSLNSDVSSGTLPFTVNFSSDGTFDQEGDSPLTYEWDFDGDGFVDSIAENPTYIYNTAGVFNVQLKVDDGKGGVGVNNITIYAGNTAATFEFNSPVDGGFMNWDDDINFDLEVNDIEDGSISNGIDCNDVNVIPSLGHLNHFHDGATMNACIQNLSLDPGSHDINGEMDIFYVLNANYTDQGGLTAYDQLILHPKRKEAEFFSSSSGVNKIANTDSNGGGSEAIRVNHNDYIVFEGRNLLNINSIKYRTAAATIGGRIEFRIDSPNGQLLSTTVIPVTGSANNWIDVESTFIDPSGKHDLFLVFKNNAGEQNIFDLNYVEFIGTGVSIDNSPPKVNEVLSINSTSTKVIFSEYLTKSTAEEIANYSVNNGISVTSAILQSDNRTVVLTHTAINADTTYQLNVNNVINLAGLSVIQNNFTFSVFSPVRINVGGENHTTINDDVFIADVYATGGKLYNRSVVIADTPDDLIYQSERFGNFTYEIPIPVAGEYDLRLHFAELYFGVGSTSGGAGSRIFNVSVEDISVLTDFDILSEVPPATALLKELDNISITDGFATIKFSSIIENPKVSAIEILSKDTFSVAPTIKINSPSNGADVNLPFDVPFAVQNWEIQEGSTHMHYYIDGVMVGPHYNYDPIIFDDLSLGKHTIRLELYEAGHIPTGNYDEVTINVTTQNVCNTGVFPKNWIVHEIGEELPYRHVYIIPNEDLDGDGLKDIVTGAWWYKNPGNASGNWQRNVIGAPLNNIAFAHDFDNDGDIDLFGTQGEYKGVDMAWAENDGSGNFTIHTNIPSENVQTTYWEPLISGIAGGVFEPNGPFQLVITWNGAENDNSPVQILSVPSDPVNIPWTLDNLNPDSLGEDIIKGDIDGDGDLDLFQSSNWLRNDGNGVFTTFNTGISYVSTPDRAQLADFDGDGDLDAVVGQLGIQTDDSAKTEFAWFEAPADPTQNWTKHILATDISGSLSVFATDIDFDGDNDIVVGEWRDGHRLIAFQNDLCNSGTWIRKTIESSGNGFDHHNGAQVIDIDNDGDLDIVSIGWSNIVPRIFENTSIILSSDPIVDLMEDQIITLPTSSIILTSTASDPDGGAVSFMWTQQSGPNNANLANSNTSTLTATNLVEGDYIFRLTVTDDENDSIYDEVTVSVLKDSGNNFVLRINAGGPEVNYNGSDFIEDTYFDSGKVLYRPQTGLPQPFNSMRFNRTKQMAYNIPLTDGEYIIKLYFAELWFGATSGGVGGVGSRVFDVKLEGALVEDNLDVYEEAGANAMMVKTHIVTVTDGVLDIEFSALADDGGTRDPIINTIEILGQSSTNVVPIVDLMEDQIITLPISSITLSGSGSDPDGGIVSFLWTQTSGPTVATLDGNTSTNLIASNLEEGNYVFRLTVTDDEEDLVYDEVNITVLPETITGTQQPTVDLEEDQIITLPISSITLSGSGSDPDGGSVTFVWTQQSGPNTANLTNANTSKLTASNLDEGNYVFRLTVTDDENDTAFDEVSVQVEGEVLENQNPIANAGNDQSIILPTNSITLSGSGTDEDGNIESYQWTKISGPSGQTLNGVNSSTLTAENLQEGIYVFRLTVTDDDNAEALDDVQVTVFPEVINNFVLRINAGGGTTTFNNETFEADQNFNTGRTLNRFQTGLPQPYSSIRYSPSQVMAYDIPLADGEYTVNLHFAEIYFGATGGGSGGAGKRVFDVKIENQLVEDNLDVFAEVGAEEMLVKSHTVNVTGGVLDIDFSSLAADGGTRHPIINAIEILGDSGSNSVSPVVSAGVNKSITLPVNSVTFNGSANDPDGGLVSYLWTQQNGPSTSSLSNENTMNLTVSNLDEGNYIFRLTVTDDENDTAFDEVSVLVSPEVINSEIPIVDLIEDQIITLPTSSITLDGSGSDPDGGSVSFLWTQENGPSSANLTSANTTSLTVSNLEEGDYVFRLTVTDDENDTVFDEVTVSVLPEPSNNFALRINTGGGATTFNNISFEADQYFDTGRTLNRPQTGLPQPYSSIRYSRSQVMAYDIPLVDGEYRINLHFAEVHFGATGGGSGGVGKRVFDVRIENQLVEDNLDVFAEVGAEEMLVKSHIVTVTGGVLNIDFSSLAADGGTRHPIINAIEVLSINTGSAGKSSISSQVDNNSMHIYPNQAKTFVTASFEEPTEVVQMYVFDITGKLVKTYNPKDIKVGQNYTIDVNLYQQGTYIIKMIDRKGINFQKQMIVRPE